MEISSELIEAVFNTKIDGEVPSIQKAYSDMNGDELEWYVVHFNFLEYPLDYVAHKCKEWALKRKYFNKTRWRSNGNFECSVFKDEASIFGEHEFYAYTEPQAIFKACQWILEQKER